MWNCHLMRTADIPLPYSGPNVYNMLGVKVGVRSGIDRLPSGIYVVNGRKIVVR